MLKSVIVGSGSYVPEKVVDGRYFNDSVFYTEQGEKMDRPVEEIIQKFVEITEIEERRYIREDQMNSDIGIIASEEAIKDARIDREEIDYIIYASNFGNVNGSGFVSFTPSISCRVKNGLKIKNRNCVCYDMIFGCPGFLEATILADVLIKSGRARTILVAGGETLSRVTDPYDRNKLIFADGAAAFILEARENVKEGLISHNTLCDCAEELSYLEFRPSLNKDLSDGKLYIQMMGRKIYEYALKNVPNVMKKSIDDARIHLDDLDKILVHQANAKMDYAIASRLFALYGKTDFDHSLLPMTVQKFGNTSVASIPTMYDMIAKGKFKGHSFKPGGYVLMASVGAGMTINSFIYRNPT